jgi:hypothetical protein
MGEIGLTARLPARSQRTALTASIPVPSMACDSLRRGRQLQVLHHSEDRQTDRQTDRWMDRWKASQPASHQASKKLGGQDTAHHTPVTS